MMYGCILNEKGEMLSHFNFLSLQCWSTSVKWGDQSKWNLPHWSELNEVYVYYLYSIDKSHKLYMYHVSGRKDRTCDKIYVSDTMIFSDLSNLILSRTL